METDDIEVTEQHSQQQPFQGQTTQQQPQVGASLDIVQSLLQQFNCLGTTDHEELVQQMLHIMGHELTYSAAKFFLDMNNWNLQGAVGCYLDAYNNQRLPSMQIINDVTVGSGESVTPNTSFTQSWSIQNSGEESWPEGCYLKILSINGENVDTLACINHIQSSNNNLSDFERINLVESAVPVPALRPGNQSICTVKLQSSAQFGSFQAKFRLCTQNGNFFGDTLWVIVTVAEAGTLALTQQVSQLHPPSMALQGPVNITAESHPGGMQLVEASEFLCNRPRSPEALMMDNGAVVAMQGASETPTGSATTQPAAMDADLIPTNFN